MALKKFRPLTPTLRHTAMPDHFEKKGVRMSVAPSSDGKVWDLEEIENKSDIHGAGSEALQHLAVVADKHKKHITLVPAGAPGKQRHLTDYYKRHGFETHPKDRELMVRRPRAKMNLDEIVVVGTS